MGKSLGSILVVDDDATIHESCGRVLRKAGYSVDIALSGEGALQKLNENLYDLILLDIKMADMDGIKTLAEMKGKTPDISVVMVTGYPSIKTVRDSMRLGALDYLEKPFTPSELLNTVEEAIGRKRNVQAMREKTEGFQQSEPVKLTAASVMRTKIVMCDPTASISEVARMMIDTNVRSILVREDEKITGIIVDKNILHIIAEGKDSTNIMAADIMSFPLECCDSDDSLEKCMVLFEETGHSRLVVMHDGKVVGILLKKFAECFLRISKNFPWQQSLKGRGSEHRGGDLNLLISEWFGEDCCARHFVDIFCYMG